jgi:hypothetical protein
VQNCGEEKASPQVNIKKLFDLTGRVAIVSGGTPQPQSSQRLSAEPPFSIDP